MTLFSSHLLLVRRIGLSPIATKAQLSLQMMKPSLRAESSTSYDAKNTQNQAAEDRRRVYILGIGNIGKLFAHSLAKKASPPPITLLLHRPGLVREWEEGGKCIEIVRGGVSDRLYAFSTELLATPDDSSVFSGGLIRNVIVGTKAMHTTAAISRIKHRLNEQSTILFTQNGIGMSI